MRRWVCLFVLALALYSCQEQGVELEAEHPLRRLPIALKVSLDHEGRALLEPYSYMLYQKPLYRGERLGYMGVVVVHGVNDNYLAYDLACPFCWPTEEAVVPSLNSDKGVVVAECMECHTVYDLALGLAHPVAGPGSFPLLEYRVYRRGSQLWIE